MDELEKWTGREHGKKMAGPPTSASSTQKTILSFINKVIALAKRVIFVALFGYLIYKLVESVAKLESDESGSHSLILFYNDCLHCSGTLAEEARPMC